MEPVSTADLPRNGQPKSILLSSNSTLFWRLFVPIFATVMITGLLLGVWLGEGAETHRSLTAGWVPRGFVTFLWLGWLYFLRRTLWRLKRVDADATHFYVTNYWTTVRYPWQDLERVEEKKRLGRRIVQFHLRASGRFGNVISFLPGTQFDKWQAEHSGL